MEIVKFQKRNFELQALVREFGNTLNVKSSIFLTDEGDCAKSIKEVDDLLSKFKERLKKHE